MFIKFQEAPAPEARPSEEPMTAQELRAAATARGIDLTVQQPNHARCGRCSNFCFRSLDPADPADRTCRHALPIIQADGVGRWPVVGWDDFCHSFQACHTQDQERRRILQLFHAKLNAEQQAQQAERSQPRKRRAAR